MSTNSGPSLSKWASLLLVGDVFVFLQSVLLGYLLGSQIAWEELFLEEHILFIIILCLTYIIILYIGELYNYYLDFRERENIGQVILWALGAAVVALVIFCYPTPSFFCRPNLMRAKALVILRVTKVSPRRGDSWLKRMPFTANRP
jgi:hypothetical protein